MKNNQLVINKAIDMAMLTGLDLSMPISSTYLAIWLGNNPEVWYGMGEAGIVYDSEDFVELIDDLDYHMSYHVKKNHANTLGVGFLIGRTMTDMIVLEAMRKIRLLNKDYYNCRKNYLKGVFKVFSKWFAD